MLLCYTTRSRSKGGRLRILAKGPGSLMSREGSESKQLASMPQLKLSRRYLLAKKTGWERMCISASRNKNIQRAGHGSCAYVSVAPAPSTPAPTAPHRHTFTRQPGSLAASAQSPSAKLFQYKRDCLDIQKILRKFKKTRHQSDSNTRPRRECLSTDILY